MNWRTLSVAAVLATVANCRDVTGPQSYVGEWSAARSAGALATDLRITRATASTVTGQLWLSSSDTTRPACGSALTGANIINGGALFPDSLIFTIPASGLPVNIRFRAVQAGGELVLSLQGQPDSHLLPC